MKRAIIVGLLVLMAGFGFANPACAEVGVTDKEIVIGSHQDLSGPIAGWGTQVKMGLEMRAREINEVGGIYGRKIRLVIEDNAYDPKKAIMVTNKMITRDKVFCFIGNMGSPTAGATKPIISRKKIPQMFPLTAASLFFEPYDRYSFGGFTPYYDQARCIVKYFHERAGNKRFGLMYQDDEMGAIMKKGFLDQLKVHGLKPVAMESYKRGATDFSSQIAKLKRADADFVVLATVIRETVGALKEAKKQGWKVQMAGMSPSYTKYVPLLCLKAGFSADGFYATGQSPYVQKDSYLPSVRKWWKRHVEWFGKDPDMPTTAGYAGLDFFIVAAKKVGKDLTREKLIDTMETMGTYYDRVFGGVPVTFTKKSHQGAYDAILSIVYKNKFVKVADVSYK
ncbi:MAG: ABC transporter substrate-binding protein [Deltaproteobacteria bacterium]|nr:ABC transporter substrate-binding protein [Deltaproteobacteria bacterium]MBW2008466.1 ABC transporter substrate-binding protein [Deltaproteobacteria bacterium]MBW2102229.1 ABC transporter substrate-binding protein [Deltaproteobacteria bacterium]